MLFPPAALLLDFGGVLVESPRPRPPAPPALVQRLRTLAGHTVAVDTIVRDVTEGAARYARWRDGTSNEQNRLEVTHDRVWDDFVTGGWPEPAREAVRREAASLNYAVGHARRGQAMDRGDTMTVYRDPRLMSRDELVAYFDGGGDISELLRDATVGSDLGPAPKPENVPMIVTGVRLSSAAVRQLDELAGNDKGGRSGLIRQAIDEFLARHTGRAA